MATITVHPGIRPTHQQLNSTSAGLGFYVDCVVCCVESSCQPKAGTGTCVMMHADTLCKGAEPHRI
jgi:hypothetical protein